MKRRRKVWLSSGTLVLFAIYFCGWYQPLDEHILQLSTCPACYGQGLCQAILEDQHSLSQRIVLTGIYGWKIMKFLNFKNVFYGQSNDKLVVLKKLAHVSELSEFDKNLCKIYNNQYHCNVSQAMDFVMVENSHDVARIVKQYPSLFARSDVVRCNHSRVLHHIHKKYSIIDSGPHRHHHFLTILAVNSEPLILNAYQHSWFPALFGMCGRMIVEEYVGPTLSQLGHVPWLQRADYARQLIEMAQDLSGGMFHLYLTDVSLDNFAVDVQGKVKIIDAENVVMVDPSMEGLETTEHVNNGFGCRDCLSFSYEDLCGHTSADHNYFAVCKGMLSSTSFSRDLPMGLLHSPPSWVTEEYPSLLSHVESCAGHRNFSHYYHPMRREGASHLHSQLLSILQKSVTYTWTY